MRKINYIVIHCTATSQAATIDSIKKHWRMVKGWKSPGYHFIIDQFGKSTQLANEDQVTNGVMGHNSDSVHIAYVGGVDKNSKPTDTRNMAQIEAMKKIVCELKLRYPDAKILGHRDFSGVKKACPSFDVSEWLKTF